MSWGVNMVASQAGWGFNFNILIIIIYSAFVAIIHYRQIKNKTFYIMLVSGVFLCVGMAYLSYSNYSFHHIEEVILPQISSITHQRLMYLVLFTIITAGFAVFRWRQILLISLGSPVSQKLLITSLLIIFSAIFVYFASPVYGIVAMNAFILIGSALSKLFARSPLQSIIIASSVSLVVSIIPFFANEVTKFLSVVVLYVVYVGYGYFVQKTAHHSQSIKVLA